MSGSPFMFLRGSVEIMAADLGQAPHTSIEVQMCGDAHVKNFGFFATPGSQIVLDINDFDETMRGPWEWDVKRMATSVVLAGRAAGDRESCCKDAARRFIADYCAWIRRFAAMPAIDVARHHAWRSLRDPAVRAALRQAERSSPLVNLRKLAHKTRGGYSFVYKPDSMWDVKGHEAKAVLNALPEYRATLAPDRQLLFDRYAVSDIGFKVVGTGSIGTRDYIVLLLGRTGAQKDPLFLQIKEQPPSAYAAYYKEGANYKHGSNYKDGSNHKHGSNYKDDSSPRHQGQRAVLGQRALQVFSDLLLGWCSIDGRDYLVRQLNDHKSSVQPEALQGVRLIEYSCICAELLAKGHARSGEPAVLAAYLGRPGKAEKALSQFAMAYADQVESDYQAFRKALKKDFMQDAMKLADK
jgi:hypothetical protein